MDRGMNIHINTDRRMDNGWMDGWNEHGKSKRKERG